MLEKSQVKSGPQKSPNLTVCRVSHPNFDTGIQFSTQIDIYRGSRRGFFLLPSHTGVILILDTGFKPMLKI